MNNLLSLDTNSPEPLDLNKIQSGAFPNAPLVGTTLGSIISNAIPLIFSAAAIALLVFLIIGGLQLMLSRGDPKAVQAAQGKITNAVIGFIIVIFSYTIVVLIGKIFGISAFGTIFK